MASIGGGARRARGGEAQVGRSAMSMSGMSAGRSRGLGEAGGVGGMGA